VGSFVALVAVRGIVGIGEASYAALSPTIIDDITPQARKGRVLAIFFAAIPIGSALGFIVGGMLDKAFGWRHAFLAVGAPGMFLVIACMLMVEPARATGASHEAPPLKTTLKALGSSRMYVWAVLGFTAQTAVVGGFAAWAPHYLVRKFHMDLAEANFYFGGVVVVTGFVGTFLGGFLNDRIKDADPRRASMRVNAWSAIIAVPCCALCVISPTPVIFFATITFAQIAIWTSLSPLNAVLLSSVPSGARALAMSLSIFVGHAFGDVPAVPLIGLLSDKLDSLPNAMICLPFMMVACAVSWWLGMNAKAAPLAD
jgi:predicted MFS family arabinose efflux permease